MKPFVIVGLGNPGIRYKHTYHNVGILAVDFLIDNFKKTLPYKKKKVRSSFAAVFFPGLTLVRTRCFMNKSGNAVQEALRAAGSDVDSLILIHDDSDLPLGKMKSGTGRGAAGHHGVESVIQSLGTNEFMRFRIGIRPSYPYPKKEKASQLVLRRITKEDAKTLQSVFEKITRKLTEKAYP